MILNQSYEPLTVCNIRKAIILCYLGKAEIILNDDNKKVRSVNIKYPWPSVIRLSRFVRVPYKRVVLTRRTIDHIVPKARGGTDSWDNLISACTVCNNKKGDQTPEEADMLMKFKPFKPSHIMFIKNVVGKIDEKWKPYLYLS